MLYRKNQFIKRLSLCIRNFEVMSLIIRFTCKIPIATFSEFKRWGFFSYLKYWICVNIRKPVFVKGLKALLHHFIEKIVTVVSRGIWSSLVLVIPRCFCVMTNIKQYYLGMSVKLIFHKTRRFIYFFFF